MREAEARPGCFVLPVLALLVAAVALAWSIRFLLDSYLPGG